MIILKGVIQLAMNLALSWACGCGQVHNPGSTSNVKTTICVTHKGNADVRAVADKIERNLIEYQKLTKN